MARMADAFMKGYNFVDNVQRRHRADDRLVTLQKRQDEQYANQQADRQTSLADANVARQRNDIIWQQQQNDRAKKQAEDKIYSEYSGKLFAAMSGDQKKLYNLGVSSLPQDTQGEKSKAVVADAVMHPDKISQAIYSWDKNIVPAFNAGRMPSKEDSLNVLNTVLHPEIQARFAKNGLQGKLSDIVPSPDGKGIMFGADVVDAYGRQSEVPLTDGATSYKDQESGAHTVQAMPVGDTMKHTADAVETYRQILSTLVAKGGKAGKELAFKILKSQKDAQAANEKYTRDRRDKKADAETKFQYDKRLAEIKSTGKAKAKPAKFKTFRDDGGNVIAYNPENPSDKRVMSISPTTQQAWRDESLAEATKWAKSKAGLFSLDSTDFKNYGGDEKKAIPIKAQELYDAKVQDFIRQNEGAGGDGPVVVGNNGLAAVQPQGGGQQNSTATMGGESLDAIRKAMGKPANPPKGSGGSTTGNKGSKGLSHVAKSNSKKEYLGDVSAKAGPISDKIMRQVGLDTSSKSIPDLADKIIKAITESSKGSDPISLLKGAGADIKKIITKLNLSRSDRDKLNAEIDKRIREKYNKRRSGGRTF